MVAANGHVPAASAELVQRFPVGDVGGGGASHAFYRIHAAEGAVAHEFVTFGDGCFFVFGGIVQEKGCVVNAEKVMPFEVVERLPLKFKQFSDVRNCVAAVGLFEERLGTVVANQEVRSLRIAGLEIVVEFVGRNLVNHGSMLGRRFGSKIVKKPIWSNFEFLFL